MEQNQIPSPVFTNDRSELVRSVNRGEFWKPCPGTTAGYHCCGYQILTPLTGCGMYCSYCVLQVYFDHQCQVVYENIDDLRNEVAAKMDKWQGVVRFGTGEFGDSLYQEPALGLSRQIAKILEPYPNVVVEFKTKSINIDQLFQISRPEKVVIGFSMNTPSMICQLEKGTASLLQRLDAARRCIDMGFWVAFHFDPMVQYCGWEKEYRQVVDMIFETIKDPQRIAWWSMGGFRTMPRLKQQLKQSNRHLPLFSGEMLLGEDRKLRYIRPVRIAFYRAMREQVEKYYPAIPLYLCMESPEVWEASEMATRIPNGLAAMLDDRAAVMLAQ